ncbi:hypothetical protein UA08_02098 [Talaromyces atroroseus]|uniref:NmrA-like domain-containing protein n=1 Tax=Talaromyces atroroseus TaxID=1441469 RepID=A0A1Q5QBT2_TALAT|nr:hypothetical protein UA08_02098 [Talaromyces atroroseus]OKL63395.1 hypothetical protein UA08_02098 [Talaromyces atroroseus]
MIHNILVIGAGQLGSQVLRHLLQHPQRTYNNITARVSVLIRSETRTKTQLLEAPGLSKELVEAIGFVQSDIVTATDSELAQALAPFDLVISCTGFVAGPGTQTKIARAVQQAGVSFFIPWQFGVDYDKIGRGSAQDLFDEQLDVRDLLRQADQKTRWAVISTGMFTSFLFEPWFGVVDLPGRTITALGALENRVTVTTPKDIGHITADYVFSDPSQSETFKNEPVFVGGDTIPYNHLAAIVEKQLGQPVTRKVLTVDQARENLLQDPRNSLHKYSIVFGEGVGVAWDLESTWNVKKGIEPRAMTTEEFFKEASC